MIAATKGMTELAKVMLELGGDVNFKDKVCACKWKLSIDNCIYGIKNVFIVSVWYWLSSR